MKELSRANPVDKVEQVVRALHEYIVEGGLEPGTPLPSESEMVKQIGVSKFSMREALRVAQAQGLVEISQGKRTRVADVSVKPATGIMNLLMKRSKCLLLELTEARRSIEFSMIELAVERRTEEHIELMAQTISDMEANQEDLPYSVEKDIQFHGILAQATGNRVFELIHESLMGLLSESRKETLRVSGVGKAVAEHKKILAALENKDVGEALNAMGEHLDTAQANLQDSKGGEPDGRKS